MRLVDEALTNLCGEVYSRYSGRMPLNLTDQELADAAQACRALAYTHQQDAAKQSNPDVRATFERQVERLTTLAEKFEAARKR